MLLKVLFYLFLLAACAGAVSLVRRLEQGGETTPSGMVTEGTSGEGCGNGGDQPGGAGEETAEAGEDSGENAADAGEDDGSGGKAETGIFSGNGGKKSAGKKEDFRERSGPASLMLATDLHYMSPETTDYGPAFEQLTKKDDGKVLRYSDQLTDALLEQAAETAPEALILSGDITLNGEKASHLALAEKLRELQQESGVQVLIIPGNHDINNPNAAFYMGMERTAAPGVTPEEFYEIYREFGYDQAISRDEYSLSYMYQLRSDKWLLMLDTCKYDPVSRVEGKIGTETYRWIEENLLLAQEQGIQVIPVAHHNLMDESRIYTTECTIDDNWMLIGLLEQFRIPVFFSGHLHLQRWKKHRTEPGIEEQVYGIQEVVTGAVSISPCRYGQITWMEDGTVKYEYRTVDVENWAVRHQETDENLLHFEEYSREFLIGTVAGQIYEKMSALPEEHMTEMARLYGDLNYRYCLGEKLDPSEIRSERGYRLWERNLPDSPWFGKIRLMLEELK